MPDQSCSSIAGSQSHQEYLSTDPMIVRCVRLESREERTSQTTAVGTTWVPEVTEPNLGEFRIKECGIQKQQ